MPNPITVCIGNSREETTIAYACKHCGAVFDTELRANKHEINCRKRW